MKTSSAKAKGRRAQQEVMRLHLKYAPELTPDDIKSLPMGAQGEDNWFSAAAREIYPYSVEVKNVERLDIWGALEQADEHHSEYPGVVFFKRNRSKLYVALDAEVFIQFLRRK